MISKKIYITFFIVASILLISCASSISLFSPQAYEYAITLKVESLALIAKAGDSYETHAQEIGSLITKVDIAYEYAKGRPDNTFSTRQWEILRNPERNLLGGFLKRWQQESTLDKTFIDEAVELIGDAFDTIIGLESGKIKPKDVE